MKIDSYGQQIYSEQDIFELYMSNTNLSLKQVFVDDDINLNDILDIENIPEFIKYQEVNLTREEFDIINQSNWFIPDEYRQFDIADYVLNKCTNEAELQRVGQELILFQERDMFPLLQYLKYLVDTMQKNNIVWGVGRGSSVASFVLFLLGVHRINSLYYDLSIEEFLK